MDLNAGVDIDVTGTYRISTTLKGSNDNTKTLTVVQELNQGSGQTVNINFSKEDIFEIGVDGPYTVSEITIEILETNDWFSMDKKENAWVTQPYSLTNFEKEGIALTGNYSDLGIDVNNNGLFDTLQVSIEVDLLLGGYYNWSAKLVDSYDTEIEFVGKSEALNSGINIINLSFDGNKIGGNGINGPYFIKGLLMFGAGNSLIANEAATTKYYNFTDFEGARIPGDLNGDSIVDRDDLNIILSHRNQPASMCPDCDLDGDGMITALDARKLVLLCTCPRCVCP